MLERCVCGRESRRTARIPRAGEDKNGRARAADHLNRAMSSLA